MGFLSRILSAEKLKSKMADEAEKMEGDRETRIFSVEDNQQETDDEKFERQYFWKVVEAFLYYK